MNRVIKFRAWDGARQTMASVESVRFGMDGSAKTIIISLTYSEAKDRLMDGESGHLMQFTGLMDKNDREIYEGDLVKNPEYYGEEATTVVLSNGAWRPLELDYSETNQWEVIGNIYENPELLTEEV